MPSLGVIQGRLTPSRGWGIQFALGEDEWQKEFELAKKAGVSCIEWVAEHDSPLFKKETQEALVEVMARTGVRVRNIDLHELLTKTDIVQQQDELFEKIAASMAAIEGGAIELPMVEASSLLDKEHYGARVSAVQRVLAIAKKYDVPTSVETDLPPQVLTAFVAEVPEIGIVYDTGNSAGLGYAMEEELAAYGRRITNVHIKDKLLGGATVPLGQGSVDFVLLFKHLRKLRYQGPITLQAARQEDGREVETISNYISFIRDAYAKSI